MAIKAARIASGKTQVEVAAEAGMTERGYQKFEAQKDYTAIQRAIRIAKALNSSVEELFKEQQNEPDESDLA